MASTHISLHGIRAIERVRTQYSTFDTEELQFFGDDPLEPSLVITIFQRSGIPHFPSEVSQTKTVAERAEESAHV